MDFAKEEGSRLLAVLDHAACALDALAIVPPQPSRAITSQLRRAGHHDFADQLSELWEAEEFGKGEEPERAARALAISVMYDAEAAVVLEGSVGMDAAGQSMGAAMLRGALRELMQVMAARMAKSKTEVQHAEAHIGRKRQFVANTAKQVALAEQELARQRELRALATHRVEAALAKAKEDVAGTRESHEAGTKHLAERVELTEARAAESHSEALAAAAAAAAQESEAWKAAVGSGREAEGKARVLIARSELELHTAISTYDSRMATLQGQVDHLKQLRDDVKGRVAAFKRHFATQDGEAERAAAEAAEAEYLAKGKAIIHKLRGTWAANRLGAAYRTKVLGPRAAEEQIRKMKAAKEG